ncbi:putative toxin-antitoxin system, toxin component [Leptospira weilii str. UI 13098]|uniref:Putative toxin-antitoxin system, toxin component n=1 Tax=Leptospira weilii str. UI 13098 TaxID=1088542 RepID=M6QEJ4_9LEPT|nr:putative toxin-antitoxin system, toxin component [Leptospira weilii str. UI 13098]
MSVIVYPKRDPFGGMSREELMEKIRFLIQDKTIEAYLFGSVARNTQNAYSDVDLILILDTKVPFLNRPELFPELLNFSLFPSNSIYSYIRPKSGKKPGIKASIPGSGNPSLRI